MFEAEGNPVTLAGALNLWAMTHVMPSDTREIDVPRALEALNRANELLETAAGSGEWSAGHLRIATLSNMAAAYRMVDRNEEAIHVLTDALAQARRSNSKHIFPVLLLGIADNHMDLGHYEEAIAFAEEAHRAAEHSGVAIYATSARLTQAWSLLNSDRFLETAELMCSAELGAALAGAMTESAVAAFIVSCALYQMGHEVLAREGYQLAQRIGFQHGITVRLKRRERIPEFMSVQTVQSADLAPDDALVLDFFRRAAEVLSEEPG